MKNKIFLSAYISGNLGDDLFIKVICERYPDLHFYVSGNKKYKNLFSKIKNLTYISDDTLYKRIVNKINKVLDTDFSLFTQLPKVDAHVIIGGSLFIQSKNWKANYAESINLVNKFENNFLIGANFGPYQSDEFLNIHKDYFKKFVDICFRDTYSTNLFKDLTNVRTGSDVVFQLNYPIVKEKNYYIISMINCDDRENLKKYHTTYIYKLIEIIKAITSKGSKVILMGFCDEEKDYLVINELYEKLENKESVEIYHHSSIDDSLELLASSKGIIATRFHAMILGFLFSKPTIPLLYSEKMRTVMNDINYDGLFCYLQDIESLSVESCLEHLEAKTNLNIQAIKEESYKQFIGLDKFFSKNNSK